MIGERSEPSLGSWMENLVLPCMAIFGCMYVSAAHSYNREYMENLMDSSYKGNGRHGDFKKNHTQVQNKTMATDSTIQS